MTFLYYALTGFGCYLAGFLTASIMSSGKVVDLHAKIDELRQDVETLTFGGWRK